MAQQAKRIRQSLELLLASQLGEYTLANGVTTPAIAVRAQSERLPTGTKARGLEVVVIRYPEETPIRQYRLEPLEDLWTVWLVGWDNSADLTESTEIILTAFPGADFQQVSVPKSWGPTNQIKITLRNPCVAPPEADIKDIDGGYFHPLFSLPATKLQAILDGGNFANGTSKDEWQEITNPTAT